MEDVRYARSAYLDLDVSGLPGVRRVSAFCWPEPPGRPNRIGVDVVRLDETVLDWPVTWGFDLTAAERPVAPDEPDVVVGAEEMEAKLDDDRPEIIRFGSTEWHLITGMPPQPEVARLDTDGRPVVTYVDIETSCYKLQCSRCGRARYSKRNSVHQIKYCRVCTRADRLRTRALTQYKARARKGPRLQLAPDKVDRALALFDTGNYLQKEVAAAVGISPSALCRLLKRSNRT